MRPVPEALQAYPEVNNAPQVSPVLNLKTQILPHLSSGQHQSYLRYTKTQLEVNKIPQVNPVFNPKTQILPHLSPG